VARLRHRRRRGGQAVSATVGEVMRVRTTNTPPSRLQRLVASRRALLEPVVYVGGTEIVFTQRFIPAEMARGQASGTSSVNVR
jgi:hypothetical protein